MASTVPSPDDYLAVVSWRNRCIKMAENAETRLCKMMGVTSAGLDSEILKRRMRGLTIQEQQAVLDWREAENEADHASALFDLAASIEHEKVFQTIDE